MINNHDSAGQTAWGNPMWAEKLNHLYKMVFNPKVSFLKYCLGMFFFAIIPSSIILICTYYVLTLLNINVPDNPSPVWSLKLLIKYFLVIPVAETFVLSVTLYFVSIYIRKEALIALCTALIWSGIYSLYSVVGALGMIWSYFIFCCAYLAWRDKSFYLACGAACIPHILINSAGVLLAG